MSSALLLSQSLNHIWIFHLLFCGLVEMCQDIGSCCILCFHQKAHHRETCCVWISAWSMDIILFSSLLISLSIITICIPNFASTRTISARPGSQNTKYFSKGHMFVLRHQKGGNLHWCLLFSSTKKQHHIWLCSCSRASKWKSPEPYVFCSFLLALNILYSKPGK